MRPVWRTIAAGVGRRYPARASAAVTRTSVAATSTNAPTRSARGVNVWPMTAAINTAVGAITSGSRATSTSRRKTAFIIRTRMDADAKYGPAEAGPHKAAGSVFRRTGLKAVGSAFWRTGFIAVGSAFRRTGLIAVGSAFWRTGLIAVGSAFRRTGLTKASANEQI